MTEVMTVRGPVDSRQLGITLAHEHVLLDLSCLWQAPSDPSRKFLIDAAITLENRSYLSSDPYHNRTNMMLDDIDVAVDELVRFKKLGGGTIIDLSTQTIGSYPTELVVVSRKTGLNIVAGTGFYVQKAHPDWVHNATQEQIADHLLCELTQGINGTSVRAGIIGELGTSNPIHRDEEKVLCAAAEAHHLTGVAINVHLPIFARQGHAVLDILARESVDLSYVALSHVDESGDLKYQKELASRGCFIELDCFGSECYFDEDGHREPSDAERIEHLFKLVEAGYEKQILLSQDVCTKMQLRKYGGNGYDHILRTIVPRLKRHGLNAQALDSLLILNPARLLTGKNVPVSSLDR